MRSLGVLAAAATLLVAAAPAQGRALETRYRASGDVRVTWTTAAGERGRAVRSLLVRGSLDIEPNGGGSSSTSASALDQAIARVERDAPGGGRELCVDALATDDGGLGLEPGGRRRLLVGLGDRDGAREFSLSSGRCAGPLAQDVMSLLPTARVDLRRLRRRAVTVDLRTRRPFSVGGVSGTLTSTVTVRFGRASLRRRRDDGIASVGRHRATNAQGGRPARLDGTLTTTFGGGDSLACRLLDACAVEGTSTVRFADVEYMPGFDEEEGDFLQARAVVDARVRRPGAPDCVDHVEVPVRLRFRLRTPAAGGQRVRLAVDENESAPSELLRTRCTGPFGHDLAGPVVASGETGSDGRVILRAARRLRDGPFSGGQSGELVYSDEAGR